MKSKLTKRILAALCVALVLSALLALTTFAAEIQGGFGVIEGVDETYKAASAVINSDGTALNIDTANAITLTEDAWNKIDVYIDNEGNYTFLKDDKPVTNGTGTITFTDTSELKDGGVVNTGTGSAISNSFNSVTLVFENGTYSTASTTAPVVKTKVGQITGGTYEVYSNAYGCDFVAIVDASGCKIVDTETDVEVKAQFSTSIKTYVVDVYEVVAK